MGEEENYEFVLGIDLGTSNSAACIYKDGKTKIVPSAEGATMYGKAFPSYVAFTEDGEILVGEPARKQAQTNPKGTISAIKRRMGTDYTVNIRGKEYTPQEISSLILQKIKKDSEAFLGETIEKAVITVPAYFDDNQRTATKDAAEIAGIEVIRLISEPTAASIAYGIDKVKDDDVTILVFDLGGGTLDVTIMEFGRGIFEVLSTSGDTNLGGIDMDSRLMKYLADEFKDEHGIDLLNDPDTERRLREAAERAKIELSTTIQTDINLPFIALGSDGKPLNLITTLNQSKLESLVKPIVDRCGAIIDKALEGAEIDVDEIDKIILVGGPTRMPIVEKYVEDHTGKKVERGIDPMECVAQGASIMANIIERRRNKGGDVPVPGDDGHGGDEVIGGITVLDVTPLDLGTVVIGDLTEVLIEANTTIPVRQTQTFTTVSDYQTSVICEVVQGPYKMASENTELGSFVLDGIRPAPRGVPQIDVTFEIDANGILNVTAKDQGTGNEKSITIRSALKMTKDEIRQKQREAEKNREEDEKRAKLAELKNEAGRAINDANDLINNIDLEDEIDDDLKDNIQSLILDLTKAIEDEKASKIKINTKKLLDAIYEVTSSLYD